jgi:hypothetical protein
LLFSDTYNLEADRLDDRQPTGIVQTTAADDEIPAADPAVATHNERNGRQA